MNPLYAALGGAIGSLLRYGFSSMLNTTGFPWGTMAINIAGSACIGLCAGLGLAGGPRAFLVAGVLGGFTTFSAFSLETGLLWERDPRLAVAYVLASVGLGLTAFFLTWNAVRG
ncbi:CrcB family protein [Rhodovarius crocodyli]|uniref:Fluoride-specific ion channel FluC n=1 Tax=Rhodovarius crocodyli TaxID=1979269 RepID=A0A437M3G1_9PROT|nr:CrcB family protein [Rhodovarius crocodyli]RVT92238.1 CrcB family protein [Rhodovarius crocodyli]